LATSLATVVARVALNMHRLRNTRREQRLDVHVPDPIIDTAEGTDPEYEALLADSVAISGAAEADTDSRTHCRSVARLRSRSRGRCR
jgi:hypothetical protein